MTNSTQCVSCEEPIQPSDKFCKHCGTPNTLVCSHCEGALDPGAKFCKHCGETCAPQAASPTKPGSSPSAQTAPRVRRPSPPQKSASKLPVPPWAIAAVIALAVLGVYIVMTSSGAPKQKTLKIVADRPDQPLPGTPSAQGGAAPNAGNTPQAKPRPKGPTPQDISGTVEVSQELKGVLPKAAALYIIARPASQPTAFPIAVVRVDPKPSGSVPFTIGPANLMMAGGDFSQPVILSARWDQDGNASSKEPGDLFGQLEAPTKPGTKDIQITLSQRL